MGDQLQSLLNTKAALDLGLVSEADYNSVKDAFLKAQQLRAAIDAGLINQDDYETNKTKYLAALSSPEAAAGLQGGLPISAPPSASNGVSRPAPQAPPPRAAAPPLRPPAPISRAPSNPSSRPLSAAPSPPSTTPRTMSSNSLVPTNVPKVSGAKQLSGGVSMSGIAVTEDAVNLYYLIKARSTYKWALWKVDDKGTSVVISDVGEPGSTYQDFLAALPPNDCRYGLFDYQYSAHDGNTMNKLVFLNWAPDTARVKSKMMYASTKDFFKGHLDGISVEFQASDLDEINEGQVADAVKALKR